MNVKHQEQNSNQEQTDKKKAAAQDAQQPKNSNKKEQKIDDQVTGKTHQGNNDSAPVLPGSGHKIAAWVEAKPDSKDQ